MHCQSCFGGRSRRTAEQTVLVPTYLLQAVFRNQGACHRRRTRYPYDIPARDVGDVACGFPGGLRQVYGGVASSLGQVLDQLLENTVRPAPTDLHPFAEGEDTTRFEMHGAADYPRRCSSICQKTICYVWPMGIFVRPKHCFSKAPSFEGRAHLNRTRAQ